MLPVQRFRDFINRHNLFGNNCCILAAVSGGMDSVVMAQLLKAAGYRFVIAHCNFQLRGDEALRDRQFCQTLAKQLGVPFHTVSFDTLKYAAREKISTQMAARKLRYDWFEKLRQQHAYDHIALAHHQNDAIETILLNLTRGTGIAGMHGILPRNGLLARPLLFLNREEIEGIVKENGLAYLEDSSNTSVKYARNKIRLEVIPKLKELNPALEQTFEKNLEHFRDLEQFLAYKVNELKKRFLEPHENGLLVPVSKIKKLEPKRLLLFKLLEQFGVNETIVDDLIAALNSDGGKVFETAGYRLSLDRSFLFISKLNPPRPEETVIAANDHQVNYAGYRLVILHDGSPLIIKDNPMAVSVDATLLIYPLSIRAWRQGDRFYPLGMKNAKKVSDFFIGQKVPLRKKIQVPLLINGNGDILWIGGYRPDDRYKVSDKTKKVTIFELKKI